ncbi:MAG TPA: tetratricopeptide repeat protein [Dokdonella sp.]|uniref:YfgM family protein n=1 Tax=Dokdonella sp. TaxID=2291710 RepID=UPI002D7FD969|nr:tetratricopeptide repeat protein [Dokdonella sp.]HET9031619.1 tetratricopeptide repeat protein [Dokdonella sp.]
MAFEVLDEHEQGELVRKWLRTNAMSIAIGITIGLLLIFGYKQWKARELRTHAEAALQFDAFVDAVDAKRSDDAKRIAEGLRKDYAKSAFSTFAAMRQAEVSVTDGDLKAAQADLDWANQSARNSVMKSLIALRQARLDLAEGKADAALAELDKVAKSDFPAIASELRGDALVKLGRSADARAAYAEALSNQDAQSPDRAFVEMKQADLPVSDAGVEKVAEKTKS